MTTNAILVYESPGQVRADLARSHLEQMLPARIDAERFLRVVTKAVIENPKLMACTRLSILAAVSEAAQLGLEPSGLLGSAYLVPYRRSVQIGGRWQKISEARLIPGYRGLIDLARRSGEIDAIEADVVRHRDHFSIVKGTHAALTHAPFIPDPTAPAEERDPGPIVGAYMKATLRGGHEQYEWMTYDEIDAIRKRSKAADEGPWITDFSEMARKTVVRRGSKYLPLTTDFRRALELDEEAERSAEPPAALAAPSRAAQMLLERAAAARGAPLDGGAAPDPSPGQNGAPEPSETASPEEPGSEPAPEAAPGPCGELNESAGEPCAKPAGHAGAHRSADGATIWPQRRRSEPES